MYLLAYTFLWNCAYFFKLSWRSACSLHLLALLIYTIKRVLDQEAQFNISHKSKKYSFSVREHVSKFPTQMTEKLQDTENEAMAKIVELDRQLMHKNKELDSIRVRVFCLEAKSCFFLY